MKFKPGDRVREKTTDNCGIVIDADGYYDQMYVKWDDGSASNIHLDDVEIQDHTTALLTRILETLERIEAKL